MDSSVGSPAGLADRLGGAVLGTFCGDALGEPFEFTGRGGDGRERLRSALARPELRYTDDTQMALALAEHLAGHGEVRPEELADAFAAHFQLQRGYGLGMQALFRLWSAGVDLQTAATASFPDGSFGNGAAMRVAPLGAFYALRPDDLTAAVRSASAFTHAHPVGVDGAALQAAAVAIAVRTGAFGLADLEAVAGRAATPALRAALDRAVALAAAGAGAGDAEAALGSDVTADRSVPTALFLAATTTDFLAAMEGALGMAGDVDTIAAMAGAVRGAAAGLSGLPAEVLDRLEDGGRGRTWALEVAARLAHRAGFDPQWSAGGP